MPLTGSEITGGYAALCRLVASGPPLDELLPHAAAIVGDALNTRCVALPGETSSASTLELERELDELAPDERTFFEAASELVAGVLRRTVELETASASRDEYRRLLDNLPIVTYVDREDHLSSTLYTSRPIVDLLGYPLERWLEDQALWVELLHPDDRERMLALLDDTEPWSHEYRLVARDGSTVWVHDEARREVLPDGRAVWLGYLVDVTERKRAEEERHAAEDRYRSLVEELPLVTYLDAPDDALSTTYMSPQAREVFGIPPEDLLGPGDLFFDHVHLEDRPRVIEHVRRSLSGERVNTEYRFVRPDGRTVWILDRAIPLCDDQGRPLVVRGFMLDITDRKLAEAERQEADLRYRTLVEEMPGVVYLDEPDSTPSTRYISPRIEELVGYTADEIIGSPGLWERQIVHPDDRTTLREDIARSRAGEHVTREYRCITKARDTVWVLDQSSPQRDADGHITTIRGYLLDITKRKRVEQEREEAQDRFRTLVEEMPAVVYVAAADATASTIFMNHQIEDILGYTLEEWASTPDFFVDRVLHPDDREAILESIARNNAGEANSCEYRCIAKDGRVVWFWDESIPQLDENGVAVATRGFMVDITDRKTAEKELRLRDEQLRQAQRLEAIGRLAGGIAHDFNNLLTVIIGYVDMMRRNEPVDDRLVVPLTEVSNAAERAASLTRQLLAFSRRQVLEPEVLDLADVVTGLGTMLRRLLGEHVDLVVRASAEPATVRVDRGQIEQVVVNLAVNARDAMPDGGAITIETSRVDRVAAEADGRAPGGGDTVELMVSDTGTGLNVETARRMFEPFFTTKDAAGTGLGLSIVHGIVEQSGGSIAVESSPGRGTTFRILLPYVAQAPSDASDDVLAATGRSRNR
ncbi:MAG TPA: PAS domain-containing protein [Gaiellaceae bacterium]|nr:PAS domain-containing protein [Gaiellaceae bacterium]